MHAGLRAAEHIMGTAVAISAPGHTERPAAVDRAYAHLRWVEATFSTFLPTSEISRINDGTLDVAQADERVQDVLLHCAVLEDATLGAFDHHRPDGRLDPAGYVKGWAVDGAADILRDAGIDDFIVWAGGDIVVSGHPTGTEWWSIGIRDPDDPTLVIDAVALRDGAVATSGTYERGDHIRGPRTDRLASVTVVGPRLCIADALATSILAVGLESATWLARYPDYWTIALTSDRRLLRSVPRGR